MLRKYLSFSIIVLIVCAGLYVLIHNKLPFQSVLSGPSVSNIKEDALRTEKPAVLLFFTTPEERQELDSLIESEDIIPYHDRINLHFIPHSVLFESYSNSIANVSYGVLLLNFRSRDAAVIEGLPPSTELSGLLDALIERNDEALKAYHAEKKAFFMAKHLVDDKQYVQALDNLRTFLYAYIDSDYASEARQMLNKVMKSDEVTEHLAGNRDATNRKILLRKAKESIDYHQYLQAERIIAALTTTYPDSDEAQEATAMKQKLDEYARTSFQDANKLYQQNKFIEAFEAFQSLHRQFKGTHWDLFISGKLKLIESDPAFQNHLKRTKNEIKAERRFRNGEKFFKAGNYDIAQMYYMEIIRLYPQSEFVTRAKERISHIDELKYQQKYGTTEKENN